MCVSACLYCAVAAEDAWIASEDALAVPHPEPLTPFHIVIFPRRHVAGFYDLDVKEQGEVWGLVGEVRKRVAQSLEVTGFDIGFQDGSPDEEPPSHALVHVVPRVPGRRVKLLAGTEWVDAGSQ